MLRHDLMIRLVTSYRVKNATPTWMRLATVTKLRAFELLKLRLPVSFSWQRGQQTQQLMGDVKLTL